jgi:hypothetical protein
LLLTQLLIYLMKLSSVLFNISLPHCLRIHGFCLISIAFDMKTRPSATKSAGRMNLGHLDPVDFKSSRII